MRFGNAWRNRNSGVDFSQRPRQIGYPKNKRTVDYAGFALCDGNLDSNETCRRESSIRSNRDGKSTRRSRDSDRRQLGFVA